MSGSREKQPVGNLRISEDVLATIASVAALEVEGVEALEKPTRANPIFPRRLSKNAIHITMNDDSVEIDIGLKLKYGAKIQEVCPRVQTAVKDNVQTMTGMAVFKVNVVVAGIAFPEELSQSAQ